MKTFEGMVYTDPTPIVVDAARVQRVHVFDVPAVLREDAQDTLPYRAPNVWWTLGEFRYTGEDYTEVFAMWDGREVWYGIERPDTGGVSLAKASDRSYPNSVTMVPSEAELDRRRAARNPLPDQFSGVSDHVNRNSLNALRVFFRASCMAVENDRRAGVTPPTATGDVEFRSGGDGGWVTWEPRRRVEGWLRESLRKGAYGGAAFYGMALRGELYG